MADLDFLTDLRTGFNVSFGDNIKKVAGNRALMNRFEITFLTQHKGYLLGESNSQFVDTYGGNGNVLVTQPQVLNDPEGIASTVSVCIERTVQSMQQTEPPSTPNNEKLEGAQLLNIYIQNGIIMATIQVFPVEVDDYESLLSDLPVTIR